MTGRASGAETGPALLGALPPEAQRLAAFHAAHADLLARAGRHAPASTAFARAAELEPDFAVAAYLRTRAAHPGG